MWCTADDGSAGWVPDRIPEFIRTLVYKKRDARIPEICSAAEPTVEAGEIRPAPVPSTAGYDANGKPVTHQDGYPGTTYVYNRRFSRAAQAGPYSFAVQYVGNVR